MFDWVINTPLKSTYAMMNNARSKLLIRLCVTDEKIIITMTSSFNELSSQEEAIYKFVTLNRITYFYQNIYMMFYVLLTTSLFSLIVADATRICLGFTRKSFKNTFLKIKFINDWLCFTSYMPC